MSLVLTDVGKRVATGPAVSDLSFTVPSGSIFGLLGPNGAGKTTTIRMILDIIRPDSGALCWEDHDVTRLPRLTFGYLPEERLRAALAGVDAAQRLRQHGLDTAEVAAVFAPPRIAVRDADGKSVSSQSRSLVYALLLMLYMSVLVYGAAVSSAIVQEKASRVTEVMIARVTPREHMAGKLGGIGLAGLLQFAIWIAVALLILAAGSLIGSSASIVLADVPASTFVAFGVFFVLGFTLYGALYAGLSAPASRIEDASAAGAAPGVLIVASFLAATVALGDPESPTARILSSSPR